MTPNYEQQKVVKVVVRCQHKNTSVAYGDDISTTGPTGIYETCNKCGKRELIGHRGMNGDVIYSSADYRAQQSRMRKLQEELDAITMEVL